MVGRRPLARREPVSDRSLRLGVGRELLDRRELREVLEAETLEKGLRGAVEDRVPSVPVPPHLADKPLLNERRDHGLAVHAAYGVHALPGDGLVIGDHGQRLEGRLRQPARVPGQDVLLDRFVMCRMSEQTPSSADLSQLEAALVVLVLGGKALELALDL